jgi:hypothetical protein
MSVEFMTDKEHEDYMAQVKLLSPDEVKAINMMVELSRRHEVSLSTFAEHLKDVLEPKSRAKKNIGVFGVD